MKCKSYEVKYTNKEAQKGVKVPCRGSILIPKSLSSCSAAIRSNCSLISSFSSVMRFRHVLH